jgi:hypothetical protein
MADQDSVKAALDAIERMNRMFAVERFIYLGGAAAALVLLIYAGVLLVRADSFNFEQAGLLFGSGGLFAASGARAIYFLDRTYKLIEEIIRRLAGLDSKP